MYLSECLEEILALLLWDRLAQVGHLEELLASTLLLVFQPYLATLRSVLHSILQQVQQYVGGVGTMYLSRHGRSIDYQRDAVSLLAAYLVHQSLAVLLCVGTLELVGILVILVPVNVPIRIVQRSDSLHMLGEFLQSLHLRLLTVQLIERGLQLSRDIAYETSLEHVVLIQRIDGLLLFACEVYEAHQYDSAHHQSSSQSEYYHAQSHDSKPSCRQR